MARGSYRPLNVIAILDSGFSRFGKTTTSGNKDTVRGYSEDQKVQLVDLDLICGRGRSDLEVIRAVVCR